MKIVHISAHLGGGVGKAHSALCAVDRPDVERHFLLLEPPRDTRYVDAIRATGATVGMASDAADTARRIAAADILQIEWWNHPRLYEWLCRSDLPESRTIIWSHISGLFAPYLPAGLLTAPHRFAFTSACSLEAAAVQQLTPAERAGLSIINSGFGFGVPADTETPRSTSVAYLGTVDFSKMSPLFFDVVDRAELDQPVSVWGGVDGTEVLQRAAAMRRPDAVHFCGHASDPQAVLREAGIVLYLLQPRHFGTAENALIEAMSLGCVPLVFGNPAECAIVEHGRTGFIEPDVETAAERLRWMVRNPTALRDMGRLAADTMAATRSVGAAAADFHDARHAVMAMDKRRIDYPRLLGTTPAEWFLSTQGGTVAARQDGGARKGTLAHFLHCFPDDPSLKALR